MQNYRLFENLPWHEQQWLMINNLCQQQRLPHALLLSGQKGLGKFSFALRLAHYLLCADPKIKGHHIGLACQQCVSCHLFQAGTHPDLMVIHEDARQITIDKIRELVEASNKTAHQEGYKIFIIYPAEAMNNASANALLKTLEEPNSKKILIQLISHQSSLLPKTIISRCFQLKFFIPKSSEALNWLQRSLKEMTDG